MALSHEQLEEILRDFSSLGRTMYLDDPALGFAGAATQRDHLGIPEFTPDIPRLPVALFERHQSLLTNAADGPQQEVWTEQALLQGMKRIEWGVQKLEQLEGWLVAEWPRDGGGLQLQQPDGILFIYTLCELDPAWLAAAEELGQVLVLHGPVLGVDVPPGEEDTYTDQQRAVELATAKKQGLVTGGLVRWGRVRTA